MCDLRTQIRVCTYHVLFCFLVRSQPSCVGKVGEYRPLTPCHKKKEKGFRRNDGASLSLSTPPPRPVEGDP